MQAVVHAVNVVVGDAVSAGQELVILEAMKMQHARGAGIAQVNGPEICSW